MNKLTYRHLSITEKQAYRASANKGCYIYSVKNDGNLYKHPTYYDFISGEKSAEDVINRLQSLNPGRKYVVA